MNDGRHVCDPQCTLRRGDSRSVSSSVVPMGCAALGCAAPSHDVWLRRFATRLAFNAARENSRENSRAAVGCVALPSRIPATSTSVPASVSEIADQSDWWAPREGGGGGSLFNSDHFAKTRPKTGGGVIIWGGVMFRTLQYKYVWGTIRLYSKINERPDRL